MILYGILALILIWLFFKFRAKHDNGDTEDINIEDEHFDYEVAIVGSGVLGSALAAVLARDGRKVVVIERNMEMPERFTGEIAHLGLFKALEKLGLQDCTQDMDAQNVTKLIIYGRGGTDEVKFSFPLNSNGLATQGLINGKLVMNLRKAAMSEKNVTYIEGIVTNLVETNKVTKGIIYKPKSDPEEKIIKAKLTILVDGCFSQLRKCLVSKKPEHLTSFVAGLITNSATLKSDNFYLMFTDPHPVLFYAISSNQTRLLIDMKKKIPTKDMLNYLRETVYPQLPEFFKAPFLEGITSVPLRSMPNQMLAAEYNNKNGIFAIGDALNMRHAITGSGMTVGSEDIVILRKLLSSVMNLSDYKAISDVSKKFHKLRKKHSVVINSCANIMQKITNAEDEWMTIIQKAYVGFAKINEYNRELAVAIISGKDTKLSTMLYYLTTISLYAAYLPFKENNLSSFLRSLYESIRVLGKICTDLLPSIWSEM